jgi:hypothetical protein
LLLFAVFARRKWRNGGNEWSDHDAATTRQGWRLDIFPAPASLLSGASKERHLMNKPPHSEA